MRRQHGGPKFDKLETLRTQSMEIQEAPIGWETASSLAKKIKSNSDTARVFVDRNRASHPEWFQIYKKNGKPFEHFSLEQVDLIEKQAQELPPADWLKSLNFGRKVTEFARTQIAEHPEWIRPYKSQRGLLLYYAPDFINYLRQKIDSWKNLKFEIEISRKELTSIFSLDNQGYPFRFDVDIYSAQEASEIKDYLIQKFEGDLINNPQRHRRAVEATENIRKTLMRSRMED